METTVRKKRVFNPYYERTYEKLNTYNVFKDNSMRNEDFPLAQ